MTETNAREPGKGQAFFDRADQVAETGNWDFAIEMYLQGIEREPDNIERGHQLLREVSLKRKAQGGKGPGLVEKLRHKGAKEPIEALINAEYLLAKEPGSLAFMLQVLDAASRLGEKEVAKWMADILLDAQRQAPKPNLKILTQLTYTYSDIEQYALAIQACEMAHQLAPGDNDLQSRLNELSAQFTIQQGKYGEEGDFVKGVKDLDKQKELMQKDAMVQDRAFLEEQIEHALESYRKEPTVPGKINAAVDALVRIEEEACENQAADILAKAQKDTGAYQFRMRIGDIRIKQMTRRYRKLLESGDKAGAKKQAEDQLAFELAEYTERASNYPTDLAWKFEIGRRQLLVGQLDEAISALQQAQRDPRRHVVALNYLGQAYERKGWYNEARETFEKALQAEMSEDRAKEIKYSLGDVLEKMGDLAGARDQFSQVAQMDYNYRDARDRLEAIRKKIDADPNQQTGQG